MANKCEWALRVFVGSACIRKHIHQLNFNLDVIFMRRFIVWMDILQTVIEWPVEWLTMYLAECNGRVARYYTWSCVCARNSRRLYVGFYFFLFSSSIFTNLNGKLIGRISYKSWFVCGYVYMYIHKMSVVCASFVDAAWYILRVIILQCFCVVWMSYVLWFD